MGKINADQIFKLSFGTKIKIVYSDVESYKAVVFGNRIGYENGNVDDIITISEQFFNNQCEIYELTEEDYSTMHYWIAYKNGKYVAGTDQHGYPLHTTKEEDAYKFYDFNTVMSTYFNLGYAIIKR